MVATKLANKNPYLFVTYCIAHKLALACNSSQKQVAFCKYIETLIKETYNFEEFSINIGSLNFKNQDYF